MAGTNAAAKIPPRPPDPIFSVIWDLTYGPLAQNNPFTKLVVQVEALKHDLKSFSNVTKSIDETNQAIRDTSAALRETNATLKEFVKHLKG